VLQALVRPRFEVYVPRSIGPLVNSAHFITAPGPGGTRPADGRAGPVQQGRHGGRAAYEERAARLPGADPE